MYKLPMTTVRGNINDQQYMQDILRPVVVPHFDHHPLATRPLFMDDKARPHRPRAVMANLQNLLGLSRKSCEFETTSCTESCTTGSCFT